MLRLRAGVGNAQNDTARPTPASEPRTRAGGDNVNGVDLVVTAMADGRRAATAIQHYLERLR
jgi:glutamate synthase (NADPH/NADH) small chain